MRSVGPGLMAAFKHREPQISYSRRTAYHEAAHVVIGQVFGLECDHVVVHPKFGVGFDERGYAAIPDSEDPEVNIIVLMAGGEAEALFGFCYQGTDEDDRNDIEIILKVNHTINLPRLRRKTRRLVRENRTRIERLAEALIKHGTLQAEELAHSWLRHEKMAANPWAP